MIEIIVFGVLVLTTTWILNGVMKEKGFRIKPVLNILLCVIIGTLLILRFPTFQARLFYLAIFEILLYTSWSDISNRKADDFLWVMIMLLSLTTIQERGMVVYMLGGAVTAFPLLLSCCMEKKHIFGGADIKMSFALGLLAGVQKGMLVLLLGMSSAVIVRAVFQRKKIKLAFAFLPYIAGAAIMVMFIF